MLFDRLMRTAPIVLLCLFSWLPSAQATIVTQTATNLGGAVWRYDFTLSEFTAGSGAGITVYFPLASVTALANPTASPDWDPIVLDPDSPPGADGAYDALALVSSPSLSPFSVEATITGAAPPTGLRFEIYRLSPFEILETGQSSEPGGGGSEVPEPGGLLPLGALALAAAGWRRTAL